ncbi:MAG TPA: NYN domain-containing protein [Gemmatimonadaceae bacterium]|nr:NYN domain-containing protein [Gemmatimonadaceae bacterium]
MRAPVAPVHRGPGASANHAVTGAPNAALLIDFDNVTLGIRSDLQTELRNLLSSDIVKGKVAVQRAYADWRRYPQYIVPLSESSIDLIFAPAYGSSKKNATDIRLAVDAIELVFTRAEIGTYILLSGDSDFSSLVLKLKEYGKYVIGVGIRESSSDLLVQNCDEYYSYNALAGLVKNSEEDAVRKDPWELVVEAIAKMKTNGDVMRADRLKQVMQEIDPNFDEGNLGMAKFSKFCLEAAQRGLLRVTKLENGQLEVAPADGTPTPAAAHVPGATAERAERAERPERDGRRRGRRGRGGRGGDREHGSNGTPAAGIGAAHSATTASHGLQHGSPPAAAPAAPSQPGRNGIGKSGERLSRDEAFVLIKRAVGDIATTDAPVSATAVRERVHTLLGRDSESLSERFFTRILRDAHDASIVDVRKHGDSYEVAPAGAAPVTDQLSKAQAARTPQAAAEPAPPPPTPSPLTGRRGTRGKASAPPPELLSLGVVQLEPVAAPETPKEAKPARKKTVRKTAKKAKS